MRKGSSINVHVQLPSGINILFLDCKSYFETSWQADVNGNSSLLIFIYFLKQILHQNNDKPLINHLLHNNTF